MDSHTTMRPCSNHRATLNALLNCDCIVYFVCVAHTVDFLNDPCRQSNKDEFEDKVDEQECSVERLQREDSSLQAQGFHDTTLQ